MASWQSNVLSWLLRRRMKQRFAGDIDVAKIRRATASKGRRAPKYVTVTPVPTPDRNKNHGAAIHGEWIVPADEPPALTVLYLHGGGYFFCSPQTHRAITITLAKQLRAKVLALDYRLAPEHPFPAALEDATDAFEWLTAHHTQPETLLVIGDSAGAGLALALTVALRDAQRSQPLATIGFSAWTDLAATGESLVYNDASCAMFHGQNVAKAAKLYVGTNDPTHPLISPLYAPLHDLSPIMLFASDSEVLLDDTLRFAERARTAGTSVVVNIGHDLPHVWPIFTPFVPEAKRAMEQIICYVQAQRIERANADALS
ncbi:MAG: alpha/beta hydrolase [Gammaproteobacteria bacterium]|nr:alpha/beta hydrolase [Gammaproteobacteria bacterium]